MKAIGLNILRAGAVRRARRRAQGPYGIPLGLVDTIILAVKERVKHFAENIDPIFFNPIHVADRYHRLAA
jgi:hypothetical protein